MKPKKYITPLLLILFSLSCGKHSATTTPFQLPSGTISFSFAVTADIREYTGTDINYFRGVCERLFCGGAGDFMISPGDIDPPGEVYSDIQVYIGSNYLWYPVVGNHEAETAYVMNWLRSYNAGSNSLPYLVNTGPPGGEETTYSFDHGNVHFVILNEYYDGGSDTATDGDIPDQLYNWLLADLTTNTQPVILIFGHEPAYPQADEESGRLRHETDSLNAHTSNRDRFWAALKDNNVTAYFCGHTHNYSKVKINTVWQIDAGHARGTGDTGSRSTFLMVYVMEDTSLWVSTYRLNLLSSQYELTSMEKL